MADVAPVHELAVVHVQRVVRRDDHLVADDGEPAAAPRAAARVRVVHFGVRRVHRVSPLDALGLPVEVYDLAAVAQGRPAHHRAEVDVQGRSPGLGPPGFGRTDVPRSA